MQKRTIILLIAFCLFIVLLLIILLKGGKQEKMPGVSNLPRTASYADTALSFAKMPLKTNSNYSIDIYIDTGKNSVTGTELLISYDPKMISYVDIKSGNFFTETVVLLKKNDIKKGQLTYEIADKILGKGVKGKGVLAVLYFTEIGTKGKFTTLNLLPDSNVAAQGISKSVIKSSFGAAFKIE